MVPSKSVKKMILGFSLIVSGKGIVEAIQKVLHFKCQQNVRGKKVFGHSGAFAKSRDAFKVSPRIHQ